MLQCLLWMVRFKFVLLFAYLDVSTPLVVRDAAQGYFSRHVFAVNRMDIWQLTTSQVDVHFIHDP